MIRKKNQRPEHALQRSVARYLGVALRPPTIWSSMDAWVGNVGAKVGGERKARGIKSGWPDVLVFHPVGTDDRGIFSELGMCGVALELKTDDGRQSQTQKDFERAWKTAGGFYAVCRSIEDVYWALVDTPIPVFANPRIDRLKGVQK